MCVAPYDLVKQIRCSAVRACSEGVVGGDVFNFTVPTK